MCECFHVVFFQIERANNNTLYINGVFKISGRLTFVVVVHCNNNSKLINTHNRTPNRYGDQIKVGNRKVKTF